MSNNTNESLPLQKQTTLKRTHLSDEHDNSSHKKKKKSEIVDISANKLGTTEKSTNKTINTSDIRDHSPVRKNKDKDKDKLPKLNRNKTISVSTIKKKIGVKFKKDFIQTVSVESYKKYNIDMSTNDQESHETTKCRCLIF